MRRMMCTVITALLCSLLLPGCAKKTIAADMSYANTDIKKLSVSKEVEIVGLGEASHGVKEYHQMKAKVFKALVKNNNCRTFIIEGDFGGCLKVEEYIHGGSGTAKEALSEIGFHIYCTDEMVQLVEWMRNYNKKAAEGKDLHFYGMDMQRFDNNKEYLFKVLDQAEPSLSAQYKNAMNVLTDDARNTLDSASLKKGKEDAQNLIAAMNSKKDAIVSIVGQNRYDFSVECAQSIAQCCEITDSGNNYNAVRDLAMAAKVDWYVEHGDGSLIFINGHNGHIGKVSAYGYDCLGSHLEQKYGKGYFAIATDARYTRFQSQTEDGFTVLEVKNKNKLNTQFSNIKGKYYYLDFTKALKNKGWKKILNKKQSFTTLNVSLESWQTKLPMFYTQSLTPLKTYDAMIVFNKVTPSSIF